APSGVSFDGGKTQAPVNDIFRAVHDFFGHAKEGYQFGPRGEYNAWREHSGMYSEEAQGALAAETLAQNAWVNFGPHLRDEAGNVAARGELGFVEPTARPFGEQKNIVIPPEVRAAQAQPRGEDDFADIRARWIKENHGNLDRELSKPGKLEWHTWGDFGPDVVGEQNVAPVDMGKAPILSPDLLKAYGFKSLDTRWNGSYHAAECFPVFYRDNSGRFPISESGIVDAMNDGNKEAVNRWEQSRENERDTSGQAQPKRGEEKYPRLNEFWVSPKGEIIPAPEGHYAAGLEFLPENWQPQDENEPMASLYPDVSAKGYVRAVNLQNEIAIDGPPPNSAQRKALGDVSFEKQKPIFNDVPRRRGNPASFGFQPPEDFSGGRAQPRRRKSPGWWLRQATQAAKKAPLTGGAAFVKFFPATENTPAGGAKFSDVSEVLQKPVGDYQP